MYTDFHNACFHFGIKEFHTVIHFIYIVNLLLFKVGTAQRPIEKVFSPSMCVQMYRFKAWVYRCIDLRFGCTYV